MLDSPRAHAFVGLIGLLALSCETSSRDRQSRFRSGTGTSSGSGSGSGLDCASEDYTVQAGTTTVHRCVLDGLSATYEQDSNKNNDEWIWLPSDVVDELGLVVDPGASPPVYPQVRVWFDRGTGPDPTDTNHNDCDVPGDPTSGCDISFLFTVRGMLAPGQQPRLTYGNPGGELSGRQKVETWMLDNEQWVFQPGNELIVGTAVVSPDDDTDKNTAEYDYYEEVFGDPTTSPTLVVISPHGTESHTDDQAERVQATYGAGSVAWRTHVVDFMEGWGAAPRHDRLHIASVDIHPPSFPDLLAVQQQAGNGHEHAFAFHGFKSDEPTCGEDDYCIYVGGKAATAQEQAVLAAMLRARLRPDPSVDALQCDAPDDPGPIDISGKDFVVLSGSGIPNDNLDGDADRNIVHRLTSSGDGGMQLEQSRPIRNDCRYTIAEVVANFYRARTSLPAWSDLVLWLEFAATNEDLSPGGPKYTTQVHQSPTPGYEVAFSTENETEFARFINPDPVPSDGNDNDDVAWIEVNPGLHIPGGPFDGTTGLTMSARVRLTGDHVGHNFLCYGCGPFYAWGVGVPYPPQGIQYSSPVNGWDWRPYSGYATEDRIPVDTWTRVTLVVEAGTSTADTERGSVRYYRGCHDATEHLVVPPLGTPPQGDTPGNTVLPGFLEFQDYTSTLGDRTIIGFGGNNETYAFEGDIDDLMVWTRALTPGEVAQLCLQ